MANALKNHAHPLWSALGAITDRGHELRLPAAIAAAVPSREDAYTGLAPTEELRARLVSYSFDRHADYVAAFAQLKQHLSPADIFNVCLTSSGVPTGASSGYTSVGLIQLVVDQGLLTLDDSIFTLGAQHPDLVWKLVSQAKYHTHSITATAAVRWAIAADHELQRILDTARLFPTEIDDEILEEIVAHVSSALEAGSEAPRPAESSFSLSPEQTMALLKGPGLANAVVAVYLGDLSGEAYQLALTRADATALMANHRLCPEPVRAALAQHLPVLDPSLLTAKGAAAVVEHVPVPDVDLLAQLLTRAGTAHQWVRDAWRQQSANTPSSEVVLALLASGALDAGTLIHIGIYLRGDRTWYPTVFRSTPGAAAALFDRIETVSQHLAGHERDQAYGLAQLLNLLAEELDGDEELWRRFIEATPSSPFRNPTLTVAEAAQVYRDRWAAATARRAKH